MGPLTECCILPEFLASPRPGEWEPMRKAAESALASQEMPTLKHEDWKYTDLKSLKALTFVHGSPKEVDISQHILPEARGTRLVFVNGHLDPHHSNVSALPAGVRLMPLGSASEAAAALGTLAEPAVSDAFANLNTARFQEGAFLFVPRNVNVEPVLHVLFVSEQSGDQPTCSLPRLLVVLERGAKLQLVEEYAGHGRYFTNAVTEILIQENAELQHARVQRESRQAFHIATLVAHLEQNSRYLSQTISFGGELSRNCPNVVLQGEGAEVHLDGLALLDQSQLADTHSTLDHRVPEGTSRQLYKAIADGKSRAVFSGKIFVRPGAQHTDAQQQSRNLLLSEEACVDTKPQLEILTDDVKCAHGAAIGALDPEELFYLQSRGMNADTARNLLTYAFAADLLTRIPVASLRRQLRQAVMARTQAADLETLA